MEYRKEIADVVCKQTNCQFYGTRDTGEKYCKAYFPECDEYEDYKEYLEVKPRYTTLLNKIVSLKSKLREKGIIVSLEESKIEKITRED